MKPELELADCKKLWSKYSCDCLHFEMTSLEKSINCDKHDWIYRGERLDGRFICKKCGALK